MLNWDEMEISGIDDHPPHEMVSGSMLESTAVDVMVMATQVCIDDVRYGKNYCNDRACPRGK